MNYRNQFLFAQVHIDELLKRADDREAAGDLCQTLVDWREVADFASTASLVASYIGPALDTLGFVRKPGNDLSGAILLYASFEAEKPIGICLAVPIGSNIDSTTKGLHWAERLVRLMRNNATPCGILTDGHLWRIYMRGELSPYETFFEIDLTVALAERDIDALSLFRLFFSIDAFSQDDHGDPRLDEFKQQSEKRAEAIEKHLKSCLEQVLRQICLGFVKEEGKETFTETQRQTIFENSVYLLYRIVFILYAESRSLLPVSKPDYRRYSLRQLVLDAAEHHFGRFQDRDGYEQWERLDSLCGWIDAGHRPQEGEVGRDLRSLMYPLDTRLSH